MRSLVCLLLILASHLAFASEKQTRFPAPDHEAEAFVFSVPFKNVPANHSESTSYFRNYSNKQVTFKDFTSDDGEHGLYFVSGQWTPDSNYFIFSTNSSGGHSPWHFRTFIYDRKANAIAELSDYLPPVVSPAISVSSPNTIHIRVLDQDLADPFAGKSITVKLSDLLKIKTKTEQGS